MPDLILHPDDRQWAGDGRRFRFVVDCQVLAGLLNGDVPLSEDTYRPIFRRMGSCLDRLLQRGWRPAHDCEDPVAWRGREWNRQSDFIVNQTMDSGIAQEWSDLKLISEVKACDILIFSDGGLRRPSMLAASGWVAYARTDTGFRKLAYAAKPLVGVTSAFAAEAIALEMALLFFAECVE